MKRVYIKCEEKDLSSVLAQLKEQNIHYSLVKGAIVVSGDHATIVHCIIAAEHMDLTDAQYKELLLKGRKLLNTLAKVDGEDCTMRGCKSTEANIGFCNEEGLATRETALFPHEWPQRKTLKYREEHHKCPLDKRDSGYSGSSGCFYHCRFFQDGLQDITTIKKLYDQVIAKLK